jgi:NADH-quinone oxidoreductase subunit M
MQMFRPVYVPGDPGHTEDAESQTHATGWDLLTLAPTDPGVPPAAVQFFVGLDGLNVWLVGLTSLMTLVAVVLSWDSATDRPGGYFAWLFVLQTGVTGAFLAFDVILFYIFFELTLIPAFFLIGSWGVGGGRRDAARKFFLYTLFGSLLTLTGLIGIVLTNPTPVHPVTEVNKRPRAILGLVPVAGEWVPPKEGPITFSLPRLMQNVWLWAEVKPYQARVAELKLDQAGQRADEAKAKADAEPGNPALRRVADDAEAARRTAEQAKADAEADRDTHRVVQAWLFVALVAGFAVKVPIVPFHTWLPSAYAEAPTGVVVYLSALLSKLGTFGILRLVLPLSPDAALAYGLPVFGTLGAVGIVYGALCAYAQRDMKLLIAYSSVSHLGFLVIGLFAFNWEGLTGATLHMVNHGLSTGALFGLLGFLAYRYRTLDMTQYGGLIGRFPGWAFLMFWFGLASIGLPGLNNFVSEMLMLAGVFDPAHRSAGGYWLGAAAVAGILLSAWYTLTMIRRVLFGPHREPTAVAPVKGLTRREAVALALPAALCLLLGVYPQPVIDTMKADVGVVADIGDNARRRSEQLAGTYVPPVDDDEEPDR